MIVNRLCSGLCILILITILLSGCFGQDEYDVTITLLYTRPQQINNTTVYLDEKLLMSFENYSLEIYPPMLDDIDVRLNRGSHELRVIDTNFNLTKNYSFNVDERLYVDILISDDLIDISKSNKPTGFK